MRQAWLYWTRHAPDKAGEVVLDEIAHDEKGKAARDEASEVVPFKIYARMGTWWRRAGMVLGRQHHLE